MKKLVYLFVFVLLLHPFKAVHAQPFVPDKMGYVAGDAFLKFIKDRQYTLVSAFDTATRKPLVLAARVMHKGRWLLIDTKGNILDEAKLRGSALRGDFSGGGSEISIEMPESDTRDPFQQTIINGRYGTINNTTNQPGLPPIYDGLTFLGNGLVEFSLNEKRGLATTAGKKIIEARYEGIAVREYFDRARMKKSFLEVRENGKVGLLTLTGQPILPTEYETIGGCYNCTNQNTVLTIRKDKRYGLATTSGKLVLPPQYGSISSSFPAGPIKVKTANRSSEKWGLVDSTGKVLVDTAYASIEYEREGNYFLLRMGSYENAKYGLADSKGKIIFKPEFDGLHYYKGQKLFRAVTAKKVGLYTVGGVPLIKPIYDGLYIEKGYVFVERDSKAGVLDLKGNQVYPLVYDQIYKTENGFVLKKDGKWAMMNLPAKQTVPLSFTEVRASAGFQYFIVEENGKYGIFSLAMKPLFPVKYDRIYGDSSPWKHGIIEVRLDSGRYLVDRYGNQEIPQR